MAKQNEIYEDCLQLTLRHTKKTYFLDCDLFKWGRLWRCTQESVIKCFHGFSQVCYSWGLCACPWAKTHPDWNSVGVPWMAVLVIYSYAFPGWYPCHTSSSICWISSLPTGQSLSFEFWEIILKCPNKPVTWEEWLLCLNLRFKKSHLGAHLQSTADVVTRTGRRKGPI